MPLPWASRITSISISFQPAMERSTSTSCSGLSESPCPAMSSSSPSSCATPPPAPPSVKLGLMTTGYPSRAATARASSRLCAKPESATSSPSSPMAFANSSRSSPTRMESRSQPMTSTPHSSSTPDSPSAIAQFSAVWPPMLGRMASGRSLRMTLPTASAVSGSTYVRSAVSGSVMMVAGFEFTSTTS